MSEDAVMTQSIYNDGVKVILHGLEDGQDVHHVLVTEKTNLKGDSIFKALQEQNPNPSPFKRVPDQNPKTPGKLLIVFSLGSP